LSEAFTPRAPDAPETPSPLRTLFRFSRSRANSPRALFHVPVRRGLFLAPWRPSFRASGVKDRILFSSLCRSRLGPLGEEAHSFLTVRTPSPRPLLLLPCARRDPLFFFFLVRPPRSFLGRQPIPPFFPVKFVRLNVAVQRLPLGLMKIPSRKRNRRRGALIFSRNLPPFSPFPQTEPSPPYPYSRFEKVAVPVEMAFPFPLAARLP